MDLPLANLRPVTRHDQYVPPSIQLRPDPIVIQGILQRPRDYTRGRGGGGGICIPRLHSRFYELVIRNVLDPVGRQ